MKEEYKPILSKEEFLNMLPEYLINYIKLYPGLQNIEVYYQYKDSDEEFYSKVEELVMHRVKAIGYKDVKPLEGSSIFHLSNYNYKDKMQKNPMWT